MPTYDYKCLDCDYSFEEFQKMSDDPLEICPNCSGKLKRLIGSGAAPIFKGSGFYQTDYKNTAKSNKMDTVGSKSDNNTTVSTSEKKKTE